MNKGFIRTIGIIAVTILYCLIVWFFQINIRDVELTFETADGASNGTVIQVFWDDGLGLTAEKSVYAQIDQQKGICTFSKEQINTILAYRIDPTAEEKDVEFSAIALNGKPIDMEDFVQWIAMSDQVEYQIFNNGERKSLYIHPTSIDPQLYLNENFAAAMREAATISKVSKKKMIIAGLALALILLFYRKIVWLLNTISGWGKKQLEKIFAGKRKKQHALVIMGILVVCIFVFWKFLIGEKCYLFADVSDQYGQLYPQLLEYARYIEKGLKYGSYDFSKALGDNVGLIKPNLLTWVSWFGVEHVGYLMGVGQFLKVVGSGIAFYAFLCVNGQKRWFSAILALGYAFCGHMTIRSAWASYPNEVLLVAIWLLCFELLIKRKDFRWLPIATCLFFYHYGSGYYKYLYLAFFMGYALFRIITEWKISAKIWIAILSLGVIGCGGLFFAAKGTFFNEIVSALSSERAQDNIEGFQWNIQGFLPNIDNWPVVFGRTIGPATLGINGIDYIDDYWNSLEDPTLYCGILVLLLLPLAFYAMSWKKRVWHSMAFFMAFMCCFSGQTRVFLNGFSGSTYKLCTFWIIILMLFTAGQINWEEFHEKKKKRVGVVIVMITYSLILWLMIVLRKEIYVSEKYYKLCLLFLGLECVGVLLLLLRPQMHLVTKSALLLVVGVEILCMSYPIYNERETLNADIYWDDTMDALQYLAEYDSGFYRIDKQYQSAHYCDSMAQGYNGTAFYIGGTGPRSTIAEFYHDMGLPIYSLNRTSWGTSSYNEVETLLGIKYILTKEENVANYGFEKIAQTGEVSVYENKDALPMGFVYAKAIEKSTFEKLPYNQRQRALLMAVLVEDGTSTLPLLTKEELDSLDEREELLNQYEIEVQSAENYSFVFEPNTEEEVVAVQISFDSAGKSDLCYSTIDGAVFHMPIHQVSEGQIFEINVAGVNRIWADSPNWANIMNLRVAKIPKSVYYESYQNITNQMYESGVIIVKAEDSYIDGKFTAKEDGLLYLPIVYGTGWSVYVDGERQQIIQCNDTFYGVAVSAGTHRLELLFECSDFATAYKQEMKWLTVCACVFFAGSLLPVIRRKMDCKKRKREVKS